MRNYKLYILSVCYLLLIYTCSAKTITETEHIYYTNEVIKNNYFTNYIFTNIMRLELYTANATSYYKKLVYISNDYLFVLRYTNDFTNDLIKVSDYYLENSYSNAENEKYYYYSTVNKRFYYITFTNNTLTYYNKTTLSVRRLYF